MLLALVFILAAELQPSLEFRQPQLATGAGRVGMTYGAGTSIYYAASVDGGQTFLPRVKVADLAFLHLGRHRGPRVAMLPDAILITAVGRAEPSARNELWGWRSTDGGKNWAPVGRINDVPAAAGEGLHAMAADAKGNVFAAWLDSRQTGGTTLYGTRSTDGGRTWSKNVLVYASPDGTICQCCDPSVAVEANGRIAVMWRNALGGSRDLYLASSDDGVHFSAAQKLGEGTWKLDACPMDGGGLAIDHGRLVSAWRRGTEIFLAQPGRPETRIGEGKDVTVAAGSKGTYAVWSTAKGIEMYAPGATAPVPLSAEGGYPNLVSLPDGSVLAAWEEKGAVRTEKLP